MRRLASLNTPCSRTKIFCAVRGEGLVASKWRRNASMSSVVKCPDARPGPLQTAGRRAEGRLLAHHLRQRRVLAEPREKLRLGDVARIPQRPVLATPLYLEVLRATRPRRRRTSDASGSGSISTASMPRPPARRRAVLRALPSAIAGVRCPGGHGPGAARQMIAPRGVRRPLSLTCAGPSLVVRRVPSRPTSSRSTPATVGLAGTCRWPAILVRALPRHCPEPSATLKSKA